MGHFYYDTALFNESLQAGDSIEIYGEEFRHLFFSLRTPKNANVCGLDGKGTKRIFSVAEINSKSALLTLNESKLCERKFNFDLLVGTPKKDVIEKIVTDAVELSLRSVFFIDFEYSQGKPRVSKSDRLKALAVSAMKQSQNPFLPKIEFSNWDEFLNRSTDYHDVFLAHNDNRNHKSTLNIGFNGNMEKSFLAVVGPEGGLSQSDIKKISEIGPVKIIHLPCSILRTRTAVAAISGYLFRCFES